MKKFSSIIVLMIIISTVYFYKKQETKENYVKFVPATTEVCSKKLIEVSELKEDFLNGVSMINIIVDEEELEVFMEAPRDSVVAKKRMTVGTDCQEITLSSEEEAKLGISSFFWVLKNNVLTKLRGYHKNDKIYIKAKI